MFYQDNSANDAPQQDKLITENLMSASNQSNIEVQQALAILENLVLEGVHIPLTDLVVVDGNMILDRIEYIKHNLPTALAISIEVLRQKQTIIQQATNQAQTIIKLAQAEASKMLEESTLLDQAKLEISKIRLEAERECEQLRQATYQEIEQWREMATLEYEAIQTDADNYANTVLSDLETKLSQMLTVIQNGRQHLNPHDTHQEDSVK